jgi:hypothetical protein
MKIPQQLHQFAAEHSFIIVAGKQDALFYHAHDGVINLTNSIKIPRPHYSDNEGRSKARSQNGGSIRSGTATEFRDQEVISDFIHELKKHMAKVRSDMYSNVYILAPSKTKNRIAQALPDGFKRKMNDIIEGNFYYATPLDVVKKVHRPAVGMSIPRNSEVSRILHIGK